MSSQPPEHRVFEVKKGLVPVSNKSNYRGWPQWPHNQWPPSNNHGSHSVLGTSVTSITCSHCPVFDELLVVVVCLLVPCIKQSSHFCALGRFNCADTCKRACAWFLWWFCRLFCILKRKKSLFFETPNISANAVAWCGGWCSNVQRWAKRLHLFVFSE